MRGLRLGGLDGGHAADLAPMKRFPDEGIETR